MIDQQIQKKFLELLALLVERGEPVKLQFEMFDDPNLERYGGVGFARAALGQVGIGVQMEMGGSSAKAAAAKILAAFTSAAAANMGAPS